MASTASLHKNRKTTLGRISRYISKDTNFNTSSNRIISKGSNLVSQLYSAAVSPTSITHWALPGSVGSWKKYCFDDVKRQSFSPVEIGQSFGPTWATHWFKILIEIPKEWIDKEIHFRWNSNSEATLWNEDGNLLQGLSPGFRNEFVITTNWDRRATDASRTFYVEMACNGMFGASEGKSLCIDAPDPSMHFTLNQADIATFESNCFKLLMDMEILHGMALNMPEDHKGYQAMYCANEMINLLCNNEYKKAGEIADKFFEQRSGEKVHTLVAMGHCHIDTAWLWPYDETIRKCARSWSAQIGLMEEYPDFNFTCSQAQQFLWMKQFYPSLYEKIKIYISRGNFVPVGGTWVEMDGNIPNGESFVRQFYYGMKFFKEEFNVVCKEFWLPDTFGYSAQIPQILKHVGISRFLTQKLSWNLVNKFPHHNFWWEGIDGTSVLTHFPPGDSYEMNGKVDELLKSVNNSQDKGRANIGAYLFGFGDGGGGPTRSMLERLKRAKDVDGLPKVVLGTPSYFFEELLKEGNKLSKWVGELYLELHNGTYTSQATLKWFNRKCEFFMREVELLMSMAYVSSKISQELMIIHMEKVDENWKKILLNQFHDVIPGSCIELVTRDAWQLYKEVFKDLHAMRHFYHNTLLGTKGSNEVCLKSVLFNPLPWKIRTVIFTSGVENCEQSYSAVDIQHAILNSDCFENQTSGNYRVPNKFSAALVEMESSGYTIFRPLQPLQEVTYTSDSLFGQFSNGQLRLKVSLSSPPHEELFFVQKSGQEFSVFNDRLNTGIEPGMFYIYDDIPLFWDAWDCMDYHLETRDELPYSSEHDKGKFEHICSGPMVGIYRWTCKFGKDSSIERYTIIRAECPMIEYYVVIDWKEDHKFLKVEFPVNVLSREATYEIQYGHVKRPTHINTSWEMAKFEVCGQKWMDISQTDKGVTIITDSKFGWNVRDNIVKLSLLRSPKSPDSNCDMHKHYIHYAVLPHEGSFQEAGVIRRAYEFNFFGANNVPLLKSILDDSVNANNIPMPMISSSSSAVIIEAIKIAGEVPRALCVRLYESFGGSARSEIHLGFNCVKIEECNGLEHSLGTISDVPCSKFLVDVSPFQIKSYLVYF